MRDESSHQAKGEAVRDDDNVQVISGNALVGEVSEHGRDERRRPVVHVQPRLALGKSGPSRPAGGREGRRGGYSSGVLISSSLLFSSRGLHSGSS